MSRLVTTKSQNTFGITSSTTSIENGRTHPRREIPDDNFLGLNTGVSFYNTTGLLESVDESTKGGSLVVWKKFWIRKKWQLLEIILE